MGQEGGGVLIDRHSHYGSHTGLSATSTIRAYGQPHSSHDVEDVAEATIHLRTGLSEVSTPAIITLTTPTSFWRFTENWVLRIEKDKAGICIAGQPDQWVFAEGDHEVVGKSYWESATKRRSMNTMRR